MNRVRGHRGCKGERRCMSEADYARRPALSIGLVAVRIGVDPRPGTGAAGKERSVMPEPRILLSGLGIPESPRWHDGRLWFCNWIDRQVVAVDMDGTSQVMLTRDPASHPMGYSIDWLPDGRLLVTGDKMPAPGARRVDDRPRRAACQRDRGGQPAAASTSTARTSTSSPVRRPSRATSSSSRPTARYGRSPTTSNSPTAWSSRPITGP